ncbi:hypothetical protein PANT_24c00062 [Moesziomyces antarcticus T-34]|uniref:Uncharacterized protein n=1 Tax=Pseudozyma antarctica (strain T-34) TaxID=1151754 RepID=M9MGK8_PSEA3|nr:hypothetical protein PANT_24c00062 [Moesziomyces antarcticus T-34]
MASDTPTPVDSPARADRRRVAAGGGAGANPVLVSHACQLAEAACRLSRCAGSAVALSGARQRALHVLLRRSGAADWHARQAGATACNFHGAPAKIPAEMHAAPLAPRLLTRADTAGMPRAARLRMRLGCADAGRPTQINADQRVFFLLPFPSPMPQCHNATMPQCHNATMPQCQNARMPHSSLQMPSLSIIAIPSFAVRQSKSFDGRRGCPLTTSKMGRSDHPRSNTLSLRCRCSLCAPLLRSAPALLRSFDAPLCGIGTATEAERTAFACPPPRPWLLAPHGNTSPFSVLISIHHHPPPSSLHSILFTLPPSSSSLSDVALRAHDDHHHHRPPPIPLARSTTTNNNTDSHSAYHTAQHTTNSYISILVSFVFAASLHFAHPASFHPQHRT